MSASELNLYWRLQLAAHYTQKVADRELLAKADITTAQTGVLAVIANGIDVSQKDVATALGLNESAVTAMVRRLTALNYIDRKQSTKDARARVLTLTKEGKAVQKNVRAPFKEINEVIEQTLTQKEITSMADCLERLSAAFKAQCE